MITKLIESRIAAEERWLGEDLDYLKYILRTSRRAFFKYIKVVPMANFRNTLPPAPYYAAAILVSMQEGCGNCAQIALNMAKANGVSADSLMAIVQGRPEQLEDDVRDAYLFTQAVLENSPAQEHLRQRIVERFGDIGLVELCMKIASSRLFPLMTRALGFASSCKEIRIQQ